MGPPLPLTYSSKWALSSSLISLSCLVATCLLAAACLADFSGFSTITLGNTGVSQESNRMKHLAEVRRRVRLPLVCIVHHSLRRLWRVGGDPSPRLMSSTTNTEARDCQATVSLRRMIEERQSEASSSESPFKL